MKPFTEGEVVLIEKTVVARDTVRLLFDVEAEDWNFIPGQFLSLKFGAKSWRAYSIASIPADTYLELVVRLIPGGVGSEALRVMQIGESVPFRGAFGHFVLPDELPDRIIFCATGTGIAPMKGLIRTLPETYNSELWYGGRNPDDISYLDEIAGWHTHLKTRLAFSRTEDFGLYAPISVPGRITQFTDTIDPTQNHLYMICGNGDMVQEMQKNLLGHGVPKDAIAFERFN